ncbi:MAG: M81 family metallopeptidase [Candidatus Bipolaricaulota bacterium]
MKDQGFTIGVARFVMETTTFSPRRTGIKHWEHHGPPIKGEKVLQANEYIKGFRKGSQEVGDLDLVGAYSPRRPAGGSAGGWVTEEAFSKYCSGIVDDLTSIDSLDGVYLSLHGAMAVDGVDRPEAELVTRVREAIGKLPIYVTLDLHANVDQSLSDVADAVLIVKRYPHYDKRRQGERAARLMARQLRGDFNPTMATRKPPIITPSVLQATADCPAQQIAERARRWEDRKEDVFVSVAFGFAYADVVNAGATVMVITDDDRELAEEIAEDMSTYMWKKRRKFFEKELPNTEEAVRRGLQLVEKGKAPILLADHADRLGTSTHLLQELIDQGARRFGFATLKDKRALGILRSEAKEGDQVEIEVGKDDDPYSGDPVKISGEVEYLDQYKKFDIMAVIKFGDGNRLFLTPELHQVTTPQFFDDLGIDLERDIEIIVLKSRVHFRRGFLETSLVKEAIEVEAPGLGPADLTKLDYKNAPKDLYPLTES